ncbi:MAG: DNA translocase FtsK [Planctomycetales bacterium]|nr:DNA translocase FtsK [Planctomycetales bacterium]
MGWALLESHFAVAGAYILALAVLIAGLLLATDYLMFRLAAGATAASGVGFRALGSAARLPLSATRRRRANDVDGELDELLADDAAGEEDEYEEGEEDAEGEYEYEYEEEDGDEDAEWEEDEDAEDESGEESELKVRTPGPRAADEEAEATDGDAPEAVAAATGLKGKLASALRIKKPSPKAAKAQEQDAVAEIIDQLEAADSAPVENLNYELPPLDLLLESEEICYEDHEREVRRKAKLLERTCRNFGVNVKVVEIETGPVISMYELELEAGLRLSKITSLEDDLAIALRAPSVRVVAPIPGKNTVGIEVPNEHRQLVRIREIIEQSNGMAKRMKIPIFVGKDVSGNPLVVDLAALPHLLIAGRTGTGKSVCLNSIIVSMLMARGPDEVRMLMIDPKMVELSGYKKLPHLMHPVVTDMKKAEAILAWAVDKMEERYTLLARAGVRHLTVYNQLSEEELRERIQPTSELEWENIPRSLPFIVIVADEMADLMMTAGKEVEQHIIRLAQKSRAVGIHLILATQKPTVDVITGLIKSNLPARIAFQVASKTDSRVVLDENGAEKLLGNGDMLFLSPGTSQVLRGQGTFLSDDEITRVTDFVGTDSPQFARELIELKTKEEEEAAAGPGGALKNRDELYEQAVDIVVREQRGSVSLLQRCLGIGYGRAARLIDYMAEDGIVGEYNGSQAREVALSVADWEAMSRGEGGGDAPAEPAASGGPLTAATVAPQPRRSNKIIPGTDDPSDLEDGPPRGSMPAPHVRSAPKREPALTTAGLSGAAAHGAMALLAAPWEEQSEVEQDQYDSELESPRSEWSTLDDSEVVDEAELADEATAEAAEAPVAAAPSAASAAVASWEEDLAENVVDPEWLADDLAADEVATADEVADEDADEEAEGEADDADDDEDASADDEQYEYDEEAEEEDAQVDDADEDDATDEEEAAEYEYEYEEEADADEDAELDEDESDELEDDVETDDAEDDEDLEESDDELAGDAEAEYEYVYEYEDEEEEESEEEEDEDEVP